MEVLVAGAHGGIGQHLVRLLSTGGHRVRGLIRNPDQSAALEALGARPVVADLEREDVTPPVKGCDAIVFTAGAGPGSGAARKETMDYGGAVKLIDAARGAGVSRYVIVSAMGAGDPDAAPESMRPYLVAKARADRAVEESGLDYTIVRLGGLTDDPGTGLVDIAPSLGRRGQVSREDVAATIVACLEEPGTVGETFELLAGETPIGDALRSLSNDK